jgi:ankyrin repeat protein
MIERWLRLIITGLAVTLIAAAASDPLTLVNAARNTDRDALRGLLKPGANVNAAEGDGTTALHWASYRDDLESADLLIRAGANVNAANDLGVTPLWNACQNGSVAMVRKLLDAGANPNAALLSGETLVMTAARSGKAEVAALLLAKGAEVNAHAVRGQTALMWAAAQQHPDVVKVLLAHGADVHARSDVWTQLWQTAPDQDVHPDYQAKLKLGGDTALLFAARVGDLASAKLLVEGGSDVNDASALGTSATVLAATSGNADLVDYLLQKDANPNAAGAGYTALHAAILRRNKKAVASLLAHGADPNARLMASTPVRRSSHDFFFHPAFVGATPFWLAARFGQPDVMRMLAEHGADPLFVQNVSFWGRRTSNSQYKRETPGPTTALMAAVGMGRGAGFAGPEVTEREAMALEGVKLAAELGVDVNAKDADGRTALETATALKYKTVVEFLTSKGAKLDGPVRPLPREPVEN